MKNYLPRKVLPIAILLAVFYFLPIQMSYSSERSLGAVVGLQKLADDLQAEGSYGKAIPIIEKVLALRREASENENADVARILDHLGELHYLAGKYPEAKPLLREALSIRENLFGSNHIKTAESYNHIGVLSDLLGEYDKAKNYLIDALKIREMAYGQDHPAVAESLVNLARLQINTDNRSEAEAILKKVLAIQEKSLGPGHPDLAKTLNTLAWLHIDTDDFDKSKPYSKRALEISKNAFGPEHPYVADSLNYLGRLVYARGEYDKSISLNKRALAIREKFLGPDHPDVALSLNNLALPYCGLEEYVTAKSLFVRSLAIREKVLGAENPQLLVMLQNTAWIHKTLGDYAGAIPYIKRALVISEKTLGPDSTDVADSQKDLAEIYYSMGDYEKAEPLLKKSLETYEKVLGPEHSRVASNLSLLAILYHSRGEHAKAEPLYKRSIIICEKNYDKAPANLANNLVSLGALYVDTGDYEKAEPLYGRALDILEKTMGPEHSSVANVLNNLAKLYNELGDYEKAEPLYIRALAIWEKTLGPEHPYLATTLDNLAILYEFTKDYRKAEPLYLRALKIREKALGPSHPDVSRSLNNLATLYTFLKDYAKAEKLYQKVLQIKEDTIGTETYSYANSLNNLASLYKSQGDYEKAEPLYNQAIEIWIKTLGPDHQYVATGYSHLSDVYSGIGEVDKAYAAIKRTLAIEDKLTDQVMGFTSEDQKLKYVAMSNSSIHRLFGIVSRYFSQDPIKRKETLNVWLKRKGAILEVQRRYQEAIESTGNPETTKLFQELGDLRVRLSKFTFAQPDENDRAGSQRQITELEDEKERLEARLSRSSQPFEMKQEINSADSVKVAKMLPSKTALVEFARIENTDQKERLPDRYLSFVLHSGDGKQVSIIDLGDADKIDRMIARYKKEISGSGNNSDGTSKQLYALVFKPLLKALGPVQEIFISPDGNLNLIPFEVMQGPDGRYLIEDYTFNYLGAGRDIVGFTGNPDAGGKFVFMGDPDFDLSPNKKQAVLEDIEANGHKKIQVAKRSVNLSAVTFEPLRYAKEELDAIGEIMGLEKSKVFTGKKALEETLMNESVPEILHLATHGFFLDDQNLSASGRGWQTADLPGPGKQSSGRIKREVNIENPLLRSGILLAGAKRSLLTGDTGKNDGIVTAEKILGMNLHGTKMVVLSACDTGLGEVKSGEGVYGLRRAFTQSGAKSLVMSLWKVPDRETKELMVQFYRNIKSGTMNRCQALRRAALEQMKIVKQRYGHTNPRYWGAFVFMGEP